MKRIIRPTYIEGWGYRLDAVREYFYAKKMAKVFDKAVQGIEVKISPEGFRTFISKKQFEEMLNEKKA